MRNLIVLVFGIIIGISGEFVIPNRYNLNISSDCIKNTSGFVFIPQLSVYNPEMSEYPLPLAGDTPKIKSYELLWEHLYNGAEKLSQEECDKVRKLNFEGQKEYFSQFGKK